MAQYFNSFQEEYDDPVLFELDVYLNNATIADIVGDLDQFSGNLSFLNELHARPFERLMLLQYPLELSNHLSDSCPDGGPLRSLNLNTSDRLTLKSLEIGEGVQTTEPNTKKSYSAKWNQKDRHSTSPLVRLNYDLGAPYVPKYMTSPVKKGHKPSFLYKSENDYTRSPKLAPSNAPQQVGTVLTLESTIATSEHVMDCLGVLKIARGEQGIRRELHLLPVKAILQMRPKLDSFSDQVITDDDNSTELFHAKLLDWKTVESFYFPQSPESKELVQMFASYGKEIRGAATEKINFDTDREMYINSLCVPPNGTLSTFQSFSGVMPDLTEIDKNQVVYTKMIDGTPNLRFMTKLSVETQLKFLLSQRHLDSFNSLKRDTVHPGLDDLSLIELLNGFSKSMGGNWVLNSEYAIDNYTEDDDFVPEERDYLVRCRDLMLSLLNKQTLSPSTFKNTSVGNLAFENFANATKLEEEIVNDMLTKVAKPQGKFWNPKIKKDEEFCLKFPEVINAAQKFWVEHLVKSANSIVSFVNEARVNRIVRKVVMKRRMVKFLRNRIRTHEEVMNHMVSKGYNETYDDLGSLLNQVGARAGPSLWTCKKTAAFLGQLKASLSLGSGDEPVPNFLLRRIYKFTH